MKKFRVLLLIAMCTGNSCLLMASPTSKEDALKKAQQFYSENIQKGLRSVADFQLVYSDTGKIVKTSTEEEIVCFYVFNINKDGGFVIVSGDDAVKPILSYADEGSFPVGKIPENVSKWLNYYSKEIQYVVTRYSLQTFPNPVVKTESSLKSTKSTIAPLLGNIKWGQGNPFNLLCPYSTLHSEQTIAGCVATCMAEVMKYYSWPVKGTGSHSYTFLLDSKSTTLSADFGQTTYNWDKMLDGYGISSTALQDSAVALLMYHCGVSVDMQYSTSFSAPLGGGQSAGTALINYFGYDADMQLYIREFFDETSWTEKLKKEIDAGRPVIYAGGLGTESHAFICDGYDSNGFFHFNWGWNGLANGYFLVSNLNPEVSSISSFSEGQDAIMGIQKEDGMSNPSYAICLYKKGLTSNVSSVSDISSGLFNVSLGFFNAGLNSFSGKRRGGGGGGVWVYTRMAYFWIILKRVPCLILVLFEVILH